MVIIVDYLGVAETWLCVFGIISVVLDQNNYQFLETVVSYLGTHS